MLAQTQADMHTSHVFMYIRRISYRTEIVIKGLHGNPNVFVAFPPYSDIPCDAGFGQSLAAAGWTNTSRSLLTSAPKTGPFEVWTKRAVGSQMRLPRTTTGQATLIIMVQRHGQQQLEPQALHKATRGALSRKTLLVV